MISNFITKFCAMIILSINNVDYAVVLDGNYFSYFLYLVYFILYVFFIFYILYYILYFSLDLLGIVLITAIYIVSQMDTIIVPMSVEETIKLLTPTFLSVRDKI